MVTKYKVAVLGCGAIFGRHLQAIKNNSEYFELVGIFDIDGEKLSKITQELGVKAYSSEEEVYKDTAINCVAIITPSNLHYEQMVKAVTSKKNVIVEKPATFLAEELKHINQLAIATGVDVFTILQVRLNPSLVATREFILGGAFGEIRNVALVQRWQRPLEYFTGWR
ncbi:MAG: Gfo/Idh/MocA family oxidoreductase, partial [Burkholderiales bacterium]|nr:Gfo/Idh/MocA family oxidoreductase [Burkholderiales bacterium]